MATTKEQKGNRITMVQALNQALAEEMERDPSIVLLGEESMYLQTPGLLVLMPSGPRTAYGLIKAAVRSDDPVIFFEPKAVYRAIKEEVPVDGEAFEIGKGEVVQEGDDVTVVTWGSML